jgi:N-acetylglucosaminyldiphosphoundecaprenol N-acetyl-beta-D-mannosaminyltransferase
MSFFLGKSIKAKITGEDLLKIICSNSEVGSNYFLLGATKAVIGRSVQTLRRLYPKINIVGFYHGYFALDKDNEIVQMINSVCTDVLVVGMGSPRQELWVDKNKASLKAKVIICVGGVLDVLAGKTRRAPLWMQKAGLEWFWRVQQEPKRLWKRYLIDDIKIFFLIFKQIVKNKL